jgi:type II secretory pathway component PulF
MVAKDIFYLLNSITYRKNQSNNKYLHEFQNRLDEHIKNGRNKEEIWEDLKRVYDKFTVHGKKTNT